MMNIVIITGLSGAGKSYAVKFFEDMGYYCVDNMPPKLMLPFIRMPGRKENADENIAFVVDIRGGEHFNNLIPALMELKDNGIAYEILFLEAGKDTLVARYKESRRMHPLAEQGDLINGIEKEISILEPVREISNVIIDTSNISVNEFRDKLEMYFHREKRYEGIILNVISFGYKYGLPKESDLVFDVRFIRNPFYIKELKELSGLDKPVEEYVLKNRITEKFISKTIDMLYFLLPKYIDEGKKQLVISIGCTGGRHRSVAIANDIAGRLGSKKYNVFVEHRDIEKEGVR
jgi:RNase adapter protein RapZ